MTKQTKRAHLKLISGFDEETAEQENAERQRRDCAENVVILDFSSNWSAMQTCIKSGLMCARALEATRLNDSLSPEVKAEKIAALEEGLERFKQGMIQYGEAYFAERKKAA